VRRPLLSVMGIVMVGASMLVACGDNTVSAPAAGAGVAVATTPASTTPAAAPSGGAVPESLAFSAPRVGGGTVNLADYAGKPVLLWFWAPT
jgi:hypothetical protein